MKISTIILNDSNIPRKSSNFSRRNVLRPFINKKISIYAKTSEIRTPKIRPGMVCAVGKVLLIRNVCILQSGYALDHLWISLRPEIEHLEQNLGCWIKLSGRVFSYKKANSKHSVSYTLGGPFDLKIL